MRRATQGSAASPRSSYTGCDAGSCTGSPSGPARPGATTPTLAGSDEPATTAPGSKRPQDVGIGQERAPMPRF